MNSNAVVLWGIIYLPESVHSRSLIKDASLDKLLKAGELDELCIGTDLMLVH